MGKYLTIKFNQLEQIVSLDLVGRVQTADNFLEVIEKYKKLLMPTSRVLLANTDSFDFSCAFFAAASLGKTIVLLPNYQKETLNQYANEYDICVTDNLYLTGEHDSCSGTGISLDLNAKIVMFTSGSHGDPKKYVKNLSHLFNECRVLEEQFGKQMGSCKIVATVSHFHIYGLIFKILWPIYSGRASIASTVHFPEQFLKVLNMPYNFTLVSSPAFLKRLDAEMYPVEKNIIKVFSSGGRLDFDDALNASQAFGYFPDEVYGSTETGGIAFRDQTQNNEHWTFFKGVEGSIDSRGCLQVSSHNFPENFFQTNDKVANFSETGFTLMGRVDRTYKIEEKRLSLEQMEKRLLDIEGITDVHCVVLRANGREIVGCLIAQNSAWGQRANIDKIKAIKKHLLQYFDAILLPKKFRFLDCLPYNEQSKLTQKDIIGYFDE